MLPCSHIKICIPTLSLARQAEAKIVRDYTEDISHKYTQDLNMLQRVVYLYITIFRQ
jgi:hypothetical protein